MLKARPTGLSVHRGNLQVFSQKLPHCTLRKHRANMRKLLLRTNCLTPGQQFGLSAHPNTHEAEVFWKASRCPQALGRFSNLTRCCKHCHSASRQSSLIYSCNVTCMPRVFQESGWRNYSDSGTKIFWLSLPARKQPFPLSSEDSW